MIIILVYSNCALSDLVALSSTASRCIASLHRADVLNSLVLMSSDTRDTNWARSGGGFISLYVQCCSPVYFMTGKMAAHSSK